MALGGMTIFVIGLVIIYRLYMKKVDREELYKLISHGIRGIIFCQPSRETREVDGFLDGQNISASNHRNSSFPMTTLSTNGNTSSEASADRIGPAPPPLAASAPRAPQKASKLSSRAGSQKAEQSRGGEEDGTKSQTIIKIGRRRNGGMEE